MNHLGYNFHEGYSNLCPFCGKNKLSIGKELFHCFKSGCTANTKSGDIYTLLTLTGKASSFKAAYKVTLELAGYNPTIQPGNKGTRQRMTVLESAFKVFNESTELPVWDYLLSRGIKKALRYIPVGFAKGRMLTSKGFSKESLDKAGLLSRDGHEVFQNDIVFPIFNREGRLVHLQGRSLEEHTDLRWINTRSHDEEDSITKYLFNENNVSSSKEVYLTEGITDGLSLIEILGPYNVFSCIGTSPSLKLHSVFDGVVIAIFDNDKFIDEYNYSRLKSWNSIIKPLMEIKLQYPSAKIKCVHPPDLPYLTDINDWMIQRGLDYSSFREYVEASSKDLFDFILDNFSFSIFDFHNLLLEYAYKYDYRFLKERINSAISSEVNSYTEYVERLIERGCLNL